MFGKVDSTITFFKVISNPLKCLCLFPFRIGQWCRLTVKQRKWNFYNKLSGRHYHRKKFTRFQFLGFRGFCQNTRKIIPFLKVLELNVNGLFYYYKSQLKVNLFPFSNCFYYQLNVMWFFLKANFHKRKFLLISSFSLWTRRMNSHLV